MKPEKILDYIKSTLPNESDDFYSGVLMAAALVDIPDQLIERLKKPFKKKLTEQDRKDRRQAYHRAKYVPRERPTYNKTCPTCHKPYRTRTGKQIYCKKGCAPSVKERKRIQKHQGHINAKPRWMPWSTIAKIYQEKPENTHVDHIIPLNHPDVCGLHVPWNLQYLSPEDNMAKSNKWDGTYNNESWKNK